jgi:hypothetical protein
MNNTPKQNIWFDDSTTLAMGQAFDNACKSLQNFGSACTVREIIAKRIIDAAKNGERDPARLHEQALIPFGIEDMSMLVVSVGRNSHLSVSPQAHKQCRDRAGGRYRRAKQNHRGSPRLSRAGPLE